MKTMPSCRSLLKAGFLFLAAIGCFYVSFAFAQGGAGGLGDVAKRVTEALKNFATLITGISYLAGLAFAVTAILKFKAHRDAPAQVALGVPVVYMFVAVGLLFLPTLFSKAGETLFGTGGSTGKISGFTTLSGQ